MSPKILVVDDDPHIREVVCFALESAGLAGLVAIVAADGRAALDQASAERPDLVILDVGLPEIDGLEVCRALRREGATPILFLSARADEVDRVVGIELGGDDYLIKPFSPRELVARVRAILRRSRAEPAGGRGVLRHGRLSMDRARFAVAFDGRDVHLTALEFAVLFALAAAPGVVFDRRRIVMSAYPDNIHVSDRTVDSHIRNIRAKLAAVGGDNVIETVHGVGFRCPEPAP